MAAVLFVGVIAAAVVFITGQGQTPSASQAVERRKEKTELPPVPQQPPPQAKEQPAPKEQPAVVTPTPAVEPKAAPVETPGPAAPEPKPDHSADVVARLNAARRAAGLAPVTLDPNTRGASLKLASPTPAAIDELLADPASRIRLLDLGLARVSAGESLVLGIVPSTTTNIVLYPVDGQQDVPPAFPGNEVPDPVPLSKDKMAGFPVTVTFPARARLTQATGKLLDGAGQEVPGWFSSPEKPANPQYGKYQGTTLCLLAKTILQYDATYTVEMSAVMDGKAWSQRWSFTTLSREKESENIVPRVLAQVNAARRSAGLPPFALDAELTRACQSHAEYIASNVARPDLNLNDEDLNLPGATTVGRRIAKVAHISAAPYDATHHVDGWLSSFHYRFPVLDREARKVGIGSARGPRDWYSVLVLGDPGPTPSQPLLFPGDGQTNVTLEYDSGERPDPIPESKDRRAGHPISLMFPPKARVRDVRAELKLDGTDIPFWMSTPERPVAEYMQHNSVCLIARQPFNPDSRYVVVVTAKVDGKPFEKTWSFRTRPEADIEQARIAAEAVARVNHHRRLAGLSPVVLDAELSRGCQLHASYLLTNLDHPSTRGLGMHNEDMNLPGYTPEGKKAGADSVIAGGMPPLPAIDDWLATLYHRVPLLDPDLGRIGFGYIKGAPVGWYVVLNATSGKGRDTSIVYPGEGQKDVPVRGEDGGYPLTVSVAPGQALRSPEAVLRDASGKEVSVRLTPSDSTLVITPRERLKPGMSYTMTVKGQLDRKAWTRTWSFSTSAE
jgi:uncharacterized protein YkwD